MQSIFVAGSHSRYSRGKVLQGEARDQKAKQILHIHRAICLIVHRDVLPDRAQQKRFMAMEQAWGGLWALRPRCLQGVLCMRVGGRAGVLAVLCFALLCLLALSDPVMCVWLYVQVCIFVRSSIRLPHAFERLQHRNVFGKARVIES